MSLTVEQLQQRFQASGLAQHGNLPPLNRLLEKFATEADAHSPAAGSEFLSWLEQRNIVTNFQARELSQHAEPSLVWNGLVLQHDVSSGPLAGWRMAAATHGDQVLLRKLTEPLNASGLRRLTRYRSITSSILGTYLDPFDVNGSQVLALSLPPGLPGSEAVRTQPVSTDGLLPLTKQLADAVAALHEKRLAARISNLDYLWCCADGSFQLLCDPTLGSDPRRSNLLHEDRPSSIDFTAPECLGNVARDLRADVFGLGCLIYQLRYGTPPYQPSQTNSPINAYGAVPDPLKQAIAAGASGDPLDRILAHCVAQEPSARFANAIEVARAIAAILPTGRKTKASTTTAPTHAKVEAPQRRKPAASPKPEKTAGKSKPRSQPAAKPTASKPTNAEPTPAKTAPTASHAKDTKPARSTTNNTRTTEAKPTARPAEAKQGKQVTSQQPSGPAESAPVVPPPAATPKVDAAPPVEVAASSPALPPEGSSPVAKPPAIHTDAIPTAAELPASHETPPEDFPKIQVRDEAVAEQAPKSDTVPVSTSTAVREEPEDSQPAATPRSARKGGRRRKKKNKYAPLVLGGFGVVIIALMVAILSRPGGNSTGSQTADRTELSADLIRPARTEPASEDTAAPEVRDGMQLVDDERLLWAPPNQGLPLSLTLLPPGSDMIVSFRPAALTNSDAGSELVSALSPELSEGLAGLQQIVALPWEQIRRVTFGLRGGADGVPIIGVAVDLQEPTSAETLAESWQAEEARTPDGAVVLMREDPDADLFLIEKNDADLVVRYAVGDAETIQEIAKLEGGPILLPRQMNELWKGVGGDPDVAMLCSPNFLFADGRAMLQTYASQWIGPLKRFLIPDVAGFSLRMDFEPAWYSEVRLAAGGGLSVASLKNSLDEQITSLPDKAESFLIQSTPHPSWKPLAIRLPRMVRAWSDSTRTGITDGNVVANTYLPSKAAPNLLLASWLASNTTAGTGTIDVPTTRPETTMLADMDALLEHPMSISFGQESLEMAGDAISEQFNADLGAGSKQLKIVLLGGDLQLDGITQNQQIRDFNHRDSKLTDVLDDLVARANPDRTVTDLSQTKQALVWVVGPDPDAPDQEVVLITTRTQAKNKNYDLPPQFQSEP